MTAPILKRDRHPQVLALPPDREFIPGQIAAWQQMLADKAPDLLDMLGLDGPPDQFHDNMRTARRHGKPVA